MPLTFNYDSKRKFSTSATSVVPKGLDPWFITGFVDAEPTFSISIRKLSKYLSVNILNIKEVDMLSPALLLV
jgi:hypothetical protein